MNAGGDRTRTPPGERTDTAMNITIDLFHIVEQAHSLTRILDAATSVIAERLCVDVCSVFLLDEHGGLVRSPAEGADYDQSETTVSRRLRLGVKRAVRSGQHVPTAGGGASLDSTRIDRNDYRNCSSRSESVTAGSFFLAGV